MLNPLRHVFFDNDGTLVDSEHLAVEVMLDLLRPLGFGMSREVYIHTFPGLLDRQIVEIIENEHGIAFPSDFIERLKQRQREVFDTQLQAVPGMVEVFRAVKISKSIVSNATALHVERCLKRVELWEGFLGQIFSARQVEKPKPHPDVYLHALAAVGVDASEALAIEDSPVGVAAARAAGVRVVGLLAATHVGEGHAEKLQQSGADFIVGDAADLRRLLADFAVADAPLA